MKIGEYEIDGFFIFLGLLILVYFFEDKFPILNINQGYVILFVLTFIYSINDVYINKAKNQAGKIAGDNLIRHSVLPHKKMELGDNLVFGLGGYNYIGFESSASEGLVMGHKSLFQFQGENVKVQGISLKIPISNLPIEWTKPIQEHFNYKTKWIIWVKPFNDNIVLDGTPHCYSNLINELQTISKTSNFRQNTLEELGTDTAGFIDNASAILQTATKPFKKEIKEANKE